MLDLPQIIAHIECNERNSCVFSLQPTGLICQQAVQPGQIESFGQFAVRKSAGS